MKLSALRTAAVAAAVLSLTAAAPPAAAQGGLDLAASDLSALSARPIGPAVMSGRVAAIDAVRVDGKLTIWVGAATGGVWKSDDGGTTWDPVFDDHPQSIGAVRVDPNDPDTVWVGTGESWTRNSVVSGHGVYKTTDGGDNWKLMGLEESERVARIRVHPTDSDTVWVCATGHLWNANDERGVYKTTDGGESWAQVLHVDADTGCSDLDLDPQDPSILYAGMWQFRRYPDFFDSGGPGSGLYRSRDGGESWEELTVGLPEGDKGRIAVAVAPSRPSRVYALVEADETAVYRSDDLGGHWQRVNDSYSVSMRPFYFALLVVDPQNHQTVYKPGQSLAVSDDGGDSFTSPFTSGPSGVHSDHHALWIDPANPNVVLLGTDGGVYTSYDKANSFRHVRSLPLTQFYRVSVDDAVPYNVYGGLQDNGSWMGPSRSPGGIGNEDWRNVGFGDGFYTFRDPADPDYLYSEYQGAEIKRLHLPSHEYRDVKPYPPAGDPEYRFNWNAPVAFSPHQRGTLYLGAQKLLRSTDRGESWQEISPDLTTNDPEKQRQEESGGLTIDNSTAENHTTIYSISESPVEAGTIWVGTDDGNLQVTRDGGETWTNVVANVPGLPAGTWVSSVEASPHDAATAHAAFDGHRSGDKATYAYRTTDGGATWTRLAGGATAAGEDGEAAEGDGVDGSARVVRQDPFNADLLYLGTDRGLYMSLDGGAHWARYEGDFPQQVRVDDLVVHPRTGDLVIATHGRGLYILDDLTPLRALDAAALEQTVSLLPSRPAEQWAGSGLQGYVGAGEYTGRNPAEAAYIAYYQPKRHLFGDLKVEVYDADGELVTTVPGEKRKGLNRVAWPMRLPAPKVPPASSLVPAFQGPVVPEGTYTVKLIKGKETVEGTIEVKADPRNLHPAGDRQMQQEAALDLYRMLEDMTYVIDATVEARDAARERVAELAEKHRARRAAEGWADRLEAFRAGLVATGEGGPISGEEKLRERLGYLYGSVNDYTGKPTASQLRQLETLRGELEEATARFAALGAEVGEVNRLLERAGLEGVVVLSREDWEARDEEGGGGGGSTAVALEEPVKPKGLVLSWLYALATEVVRVR